MNFICSAEEGNVATDVAVLSQLRSNNITNAVGLLESELDGSLSGLGIYIAYIPKSERESGIKTLQMAKAYRDKFPHTNDDSEINQSVSNAFLLLNTSVSK